MTGPTIRVRAISLNNQERLGFEVDGPDVPMQLLTLSVDTPPLQPFLTMTSDPGTDTDLVMGAGKALESDLDQHPNWDSALRTLVKAATAGRRISVEIPPVARSAQNYPWEILYNADAGGFLSVEAGIPFVRLVPPVPGRQRPVAIFDAPLRLLSVIAAADVDGTGEWRALNAALGRWDKPINCHVIVHDPALQAVIAAENPTVTSALVPADAGALIGQITDFGPNLFHVLCHGLSGATPRLEIATPGAALGDAPIYLGGQQLAQALGSCWLAMLNACSSGHVDPVSGSNSIASDVVEQGVTFATSMRQDVPITVASEFTKSFLGQLLEDLSGTIGAGGSAVMSPEVALGQARASIIHAFGGAAVIPRIKEWSLPILLAGVPQLEIKPPSPEVASQPELIALVTQIRQLEDALRNSEWSDAQRDQIEDRIRELRKKLES